MEELYTDGQTAERTDLRGRREQFSLEDKAASSNVFLFAHVEVGVEGGEGGLEQMDWLSLLYGLDVEVLVPQLHRGDARIIGGGEFLGQLFILNSRTINSSLPSRLGFPKISFR